MNSKQKYSLFILLALAVCVALAVFISPFAATSPDGLEHVAEKQGFAHRTEGEPAWQHSPVPDYAIPGIRNEKVATGMAGLLGTILVFGVAWGAGRLLARRPSATQQKDQP